MNIYRGMKLWPFTRDGAAVAFIEPRFCDFLRSQGIQLPEEYLDLLRATNGGRIDFKQKVTFECDSPRRTEQLSQLYPSDPEMKWEGIESQRVGCLEYYPPYLFFVASCFFDRMLAIVSGSDSHGSCVVVDLRKTKLTKATMPEDLLTSRGVALASPSFGGLPGKIRINED